ncbi:uncharacterized protein TNCT_552041 [Trichonephila clavata]|uniref:Uncharacterized protein n=1 Tax=Trichonephila clavata TaxID=2740835 RepID=A0A8X6LSK6_TRICU|nr:uncharacterized protein TNCT_552041 [Trichonephila clavata]
MGSKFRLTDVSLARCHDEFRGPRSDYVRQVAEAALTQKAVMGFTFEGKKVEPLNITNVCGFRKCAEDQCCVGTVAIGYCLNSPAEGEPCANRTFKIEKYFCGRCGDSMECVDEICRKTGNSIEPPFFFN